ncbi:DDE-TNP-IS1595 domain-containing protein [Vairimorpha necatrix]|uniref:DDE-TNP-IS1595 domain-containing protein n=1 Tax=Vairimorpha necatrix TaxID=6039 RepID=A0AAX4JGV8_9MICR
MKYSKTTKKHWNFSQDIMFSGKALDGKVFRCVNTSCRRRMSTRKGSKLEKIRNDANKVLKGIHCWIFNASSYHAVNLCKISEPTYIKLKNIIDELIGEREQEEKQIGGEGVEVQYDETAICNGLIIENPISVDDDIPGIQ